LGQSFRSRARTLDEPGWRAVIGQTEQEDQALPPLVPGQDEAEGVAVRTNDLQLAAEKTKPHARITEARLLSLMESAGEEIEDEEIAAAISEKGIGTPATRADIIENLIAKGYLVRAGKSLRPTVKGIRLVDVLRRIKIDRLASASLTGELEYDLKRVERGSPKRASSWTRSSTTPSRSSTSRSRSSTRTSTPTSSRSGSARCAAGRCSSARGSTAASSSRLTEETDCRFRI
jgi:DNA topoisomerase-3